MSPAALVAAALLAAAPSKPAAPAEPIPGVDGVPVRVERRLLVKTDHVFLGGGLSYLARGDYYYHPALTLTGALYRSERGGFEARASLFFSGLTGAGREVFDRTGLVPDASKPTLMLTGGWRHSVAYGKVLVGTESGRLVHLDVSLGGHAGATITGRGLVPTVLVGPGVLARLGPKLHAQLDVHVVGSYEPQRLRGGLAFGVMPTLTLGGAL